MRFIKYFTGLIIFAAIVVTCSHYFPLLIRLDPEFNTVKFNPKLNTIKFYLKDSTGNKLNNLLGLKLFLKNSSSRLIFATNGGMYNKAQEPMGLYIENGDIKFPINRLKVIDNTPNFYLQPNGIFYLTNEKEAGICCTDNYVTDANIQYATQSGPMLLINGQINPLFNANSKNIQIRNAVGITRKGELIFTISKNPVNFYDLTMHLKASGAVQALYLDGYVSRIYSADQNIKQYDGNMCVLIGVSEKSDKR